MEQLRGALWGEDGFVDNMVGVGDNGGGIEGAAEGGGEGGGQGSQSSSAAGGPPAAPGTAGQR